ncbi:hypothetical protein ACP4OV_021954 [Aristida adscensionis]
MKSSTLLVILVLQAALATAVFAAIAQENGMKSSTPVVILVLQAALAMAVFSAMAKENAGGRGAVDPGLPPPGKFRCCDDCDDLYSGLITCKDVHYRCHRACDNCTIVASHPVKKYTCSDIYFGSCGYPCHKNN